MRVGKRHGVVNGSLAVPQVARDWSGGTIVAAFPSKSTAATTRSLTSRSRSIAQSWSRRSAAASAASAETFGAPVGVMLAMSHVPTASASANHASVNGILSRSPAACSR